LDAPKTIRWSIVENFGEAENRLIRAFQAHAGRLPFGNRVRAARMLLNSKVSTRFPLPTPVAMIYKATAELSALYPGRPFTPDGHLVGSIGEVVAAEVLGLTLYPPSRPGHDAFDANGDVQIKMTAGRSIFMYATAMRLVVLRVVSPQEAEIVYDGPGEIAWTNAGKMGKNGQRMISLARLRTLATQAEQSSG
jgi:hypothetical protein